MLKHGTGCNLKAKIQEQQRELDTMKLVVCGWIREQLTALGEDVVMDDDVTIEYDTHFSEYYFTTLKVNGDVVRKHTESEKEEEDDEYPIENLSWNVIMELEEYFIKNVVLPNRPIIDCSHTMLPIFCERWQIAGTLETAELDTPSPDSTNDKIARMNEETDTLFHSSLTHEEVLAIYEKFTLTQTDNVKLIHDRYENTTDKKSDYSDKHEKRVESITQTLNKWKKQI